LQLKGKDETQELAQVLILGVKYLKIPPISPYLSYVLHRGQIEVQEEE
jgi:hypothetical protein